MPHETEILANESGIQYTGVNDASSVTGDYPIQGVMTGIFKRGRFDRPMTIHKGNIKAMLGFEPKNPYYNAVQDALETGVPSVQVLRLKAKKVDDSIESVPHATIWFTGTQSAYAEVLIEITKDGHVHKFGGNGSVLSDLTYAIQEALNIQFYISCGGEVEISNLSEIDAYKVEIYSTNMEIAIGGNNNPTLISNTVKNSVQFYLSKKLPTIPNIIVTAAVVEYDAFTLDPLLGAYEELKVDASFNYLLNENSSILIKSNTNNIIFELNKANNFTLQVPIILPDYIYYNYGRADWYHTPDYELTKIINTGNVTGVVSNQIQQKLTLIDSVYVNAVKNSEFTLEYTDRDTGTRKTKILKSLGEMQQVRPIDGSEVNVKANSVTTIQFNQIFQDYSWHYDGSYFISSNKGVGKLTMNIGQSSFDTNGLLLSLRSPDTYSWIVLDFSFMNYNKL